jgi:hypothetical protein
MRLASRIPLILQSTNDPASVEVLKESSKNYVWRDAKHRGRDDRAPRKCACANISFENVEEPCSLRRTFQSFSRNVNLSPICLTGKNASGNQQHRNPESRGDTFAEADVGPSHVQERYEVVELEDLAVFQ